MNTSKSRKTRFSCSPVAESLETRQVLSGGAGNTIAIIPSQITNPAQTTDVPFTINTRSFTAPTSHKLLLGVAAVSNGSAASPQIQGVYDSHGTKLSASTHAQGKAVKTTSGAPITPSLVAEIPMNGNQVQGSNKTFLLRIKGKSGSGAGAVLTGYYLPGDVNGDGKVDKTDIAAIQKLIGTNATSTNYNFNADANRDGKITKTDLQLAQQNLGAASSILPLISADLNPTNSSRIVSTSTVQLKGVASAGAEVAYTPVGSTTPSGSTTADGTGNYLVTLPLQPGSNTFKVASTDSFGQTITGSIAAITYQPLQGTSSNSQTTAATGSTSTSATA